MEELSLNETPVRTSKNFLINDIKLEEINFPNKLEAFKGIDISCNSTKINFSSKVSHANLTYGLGETFTKEVNNNANKNLKIEIDSKTRTETQVIFKFDEENLNLIDNLEIIANKDTKATIILKYVSKEEIKAFHNGIIRVFAKKGADIKVILINLLSQASNNFISIENVLEENSKVNFTTVDFGGKNSITNYYSNLSGNNSDNRLNTIYLGKDNQLFDLNYIAELYGEKSKVNIEVQGALKDIAKKHFKGTIDFKKGCKKSKGNENEFCMLLSDKAKSLGLPMLLCSEEDVEGNHSSAAGKVGQKELFYIMSRGFDLKDALKLMVKAKFNNILKEIKKDELREEIIKEIENKLD